MAEVAVRLPSMLANLVKSERSVDVQADTVEGALESLFVIHPELRVHIYDEQKAIRQHVNCFHNDTIVRDGDMGEALSDGDTVTILQAVSGGTPGLVSIDASLSDAGIDRKRPGK